MFESAFDLGAAGVVRRASVVIPETDLARLREARQRSLMHEREALIPGPLNPVASP